MFKFDNAFKTKAGTIGIQFVNHKVKNHLGFQTATIYIDNKGITQVSCTVKELTKEEEVFLIKEYNHLLPRFIPR